VLCDKGSGFDKFESCLRGAFPEGSDASRIHTFFKTEKFGNYGSEIGQDNKKYTKYLWDSRSLSNYKLAIGIFEDQNGKLIWDVDHSEFPKLKQAREIQLRYMKDMFYRSSAAKLLTICNIDPEIFTVEEFQKSSAECILNSFPIDSDPYNLKIHLFQHGFKNLADSKREVFDWVYTPNPIYKLKVKISVNEANEIGELKIIK